ncbi:MAG: hypothetical protein IJ558_04630 [Treponema sp.]|nr:hypothetical protein [Treponema sp.]
MKKIKTVLALFSTLSLLFLSGMFVSCDDGDSSGNNENTDTKSTESDPDANSEKTKEDETNDPSDDTSLSEATLWVVGDSTVCDYGDYVKDASAKITDSSYFYPRYGYGMQLYNYLSSKITVNNLALSGRSSKSFLSEDNYTMLKAGIKKGDFLVIGFGHNDEKSDDDTRFADANASTDTEGSFKYNLYTYYAKVALAAGATPILCSPICRLNIKEDYTGSYAHVTSTGDYGKAVVELGTEKNIQVVDLTSITKALYTELGYNEAIYFHAMTSGSSDTEPKLTSVDTTHINVYGAKRVSYEFAKAISESNCTLKPYVDTAKLTVPTKDADLIQNPNYTYVAYTAVDWTKYEAIERFKVTRDGWYGTAFGDCGGDPTTDEKGFFANDEKTGQSTSGNGSGKFASSSEGFSFYFKPVSISRNFTVSATVKVITIPTSVNQSGFGLMLRDDCYVPTNDKSIASNYVAAGFLGSKSDITANFSRTSSSSITKTSNAIDGAYDVDDTATFTIKRLGQVVTVTTVYKSKTYETTYTDFDFVAKDNDFMYVGIFATRGTTVEITNVSFTDDGESQGA